MSIEQKYAYLYTILAFLTYADDEDSEDIETLEENSLIYMQMAILLDDNLNLIGMTQDNLSSALSFFDNQMLSPVDYLRGVDSLILDSLLFVCSCIVETKKTEYKGAGAGQRKKLTELLLRSWRWIVVSGIIRSRGRAFMNPAVC